MKRLALVLAFCSTAAFAQNTATFRFVIPENTVGTITTSAGWVLPSFWDNRSPIRVFVKTSDSHADAFIVTLTYNIASMSSGITAQQTVFSDRSTAAPVFLDFFIRTDAQIVGVSVRAVEFNQLTISSFTP